MWPIQVCEDCLQMGSPAIKSYALLEEERLVLIDGGFPDTGVKCIEKSLELAGRSLTEVSDIIISHGHIDHTLNIRELAKMSGARVWAPRRDREHIEAQHSYHGISRICDFLERIGRRHFRYRAPEVTHWFEPGDNLPFWGGLEVIGLPGHTFGHCGFYSPQRRLLFASDLFSNFYGIPKAPPPWFNDNTEMALQSIINADRMDLSGGVLVNHSMSRQPSDLRADLAKLAARFRKRSEIC